MVTLSEEVKEQLIADINIGNEAALRGMMETLKICMGDKQNPNIIQVELTLSQLDYMEKWGEKLNGTGMDSLIRLMIDAMMRAQPHLGE